MNNEEKAAQDAIDREKELEKQKAISEKYPASFFDMGKARQVVYSILMGFVLKYFIEHVYDNREVIFSLDTAHFTVYSCILIYFFLNCFRFLFGLVDYSNMTDEKFAPQDTDWNWSNFLQNTLKLFVINTGVFQMMIFSFSVFLLFPHFDVSKDIALESKIAALVVEMPEIIINFCLSVFSLLIIDIISLYLFKKYVDKKDFVKREKAQFAIWYAADLIEAIVSGLLLYLIYKSQPTCATSFQKGLLIMLTGLAILETVAFYKYLERPFMWIRDFWTFLCNAIRNFKFKE